MNHRDNKSREKRTGSLEKGLIHKPLKSVCKIMGI